MRVAQREQPCLFTLLAEPQRQTASEVRANSVGLWGWVTKQPPDFCWPVGLLAWTVGFSGQALSLALHWMADPCWTPTKHLLTERRHQGQEEGHFIFLSPALRPLTSFLGVTGTFITDAREEESGSGR